MRDLCSNEVVRKAPFRSPPTSRHARADVRSPNLPGSFDGFPTESRNSRSDPIAVTVLVSNTEPVTEKHRDPLEQRAAGLRRMTPSLVADLHFYSTADGGRQSAAPPGWGCPCMVSQQRPLSGYDGWLILSEPLQPGEKRAAVPFVFLSSEGADVMRKAGRFYLWEGKFIGEAVIVS